MAALTRPPMLPTTHIGLGQSVKFRQFWYRTSVLFIGSRDTGAVGGTTDDTF